MFFTLRINYLLAKIMKHDMSMFVDGFGIQEKKIFAFLTSPQNILFIYNMGENRFNMISPTLFADRLSRKNINIMSTFFDLP